MTNKEVKLSFSVIRYCYTAKIVYVFELKETKREIIALIFDMYKDFCTPNTPRA